MHGNIVKAKTGAGGMTTVPPYWSTLLVYWLVCYFEKESHFLVWVPWSPETCLPLPSECWDYRHVLPYQAPDRILDTHIRTHSVSPTEWYLNSWQLGKSDRFLGEIRYHLQPIIWGTRDVNYPGDEHSEASHHWDFTEERKLPPELSKPLKFTMEKQGTPWLSPRVHRLMWIPHKVWGWREQWICVLCVATSGRPR